MPIHLADYLSIMDPSPPSCRHPDIRSFDGVRSCFSCGSASFKAKLYPRPADQNFGEKKYIYQRLNYELGQEFRLLILFPGSRDNDIICDIIHVNLLDNPDPYAALSYTWATDIPGQRLADATLSQKIYCQGAFIPVTKNCEAALRRLRKKGQKRVVWVDAICIDQKNVNERNHQVSLMKTIYSTAAQVVIYLGPGTVETNIALDLLDLGMTAEADLEAAIPDKYISDIIRSLLGRRWFDRVWVIQEVAFAKTATLITDTKSIAWSRSSIQRLRRMCAVHSITTPAVVRWFPRHRSSADLLSVLHAASNCSATDPRDKVFAILGLIEQSGQSLPPVEYSKTPGELFTDVAKFFIGKDKNLDVLGPVIFLDWSGVDLISNPLQSKLLVV